MIRTLTDGKYIWIETWVADTAESLNPSHREEGKHGDRGKWFIQHNRISIAVSPRVMSKRILFYKYVHHITQILTLLI